MFRGRERVYNEAVYVNSTTTTLDIPFATLDSSHIVDIKTHSYQSTVDEGYPVIFYSIIFLGAGVTQATAGDPCNPVGAIVTSCERSNSWGSRGLINSADAVEACASTQRAGGGPAEGSFARAFITAAQPLWVCA